MASSPKIDAPFAIGAQLDARAAHPAVAQQVALRQGERVWTYARFRDEAVRTAHFLRARLGPCDDARPGHVAMLLENHLELLALYAGCGYAGLTLFGVNSGLRGETLAGVIEGSGARLLVVDEKLYPEVERIRAGLRTLPDENLLVLRTQSETALGTRDFGECLAAEVAKPGESLDTPALSADVRI